MTGNDRETFEHCWSQFRTQLKARLVKRSQGNLLSDKQWQQVLQDTAADWTSEESICGRWLMDYQLREPQKADEIRSILLHMHTPSVQIHRNIPRVFETAAPAAGLGAGFLISHQLQASMLGQAAASLVPAGVLYLSVKNLRTQIHEKNLQDQMDARMKQLEPYHHRICEILSPKE